MEEPPILELLNIAVCNQIGKLSREFEANPQDNYFDRLIKHRDQEIEDPHNPNLKHNLTQYLCSYADAFMYRSKSKAEEHIPKQIFVLLAHTLALMAFAPGGVRLFGYHWSSEK
jgi:hypothetical protein